MAAQHEVEHLEDEEIGGQVAPVVQIEEGAKDAQGINKRPFSRFHEPVTTGYSSTTVPKAGHPLVMDPTLLTPRALDLIPPGVVGHKDRPTVELYFTRHPYELNISPAFVHEMNANVLAILQQSPRAIVDSLSAIGHSYLTSRSRQASSLAVLRCRARILATLRANAQKDYNLEVMVFMLLALSAVELVDSSQAAADTDADTDTAEPPETTIPAVIANAASLLAHHRSTGRAVSSLARYFIRALARQDMIVALVRLHRPQIPTGLWLDEAARTSADRLMGYTATLMPLLEELCALAEDVKTLRGGVSVQQAEMGYSSQPYSPGQVEAPLYSDHSTPPILNSPLVLCPSTTISSPPTGAEIRATFAQRAEDLRRRIEAWKPNIAHGLSFRDSRRYLSQAACYRSGALLYLFRLLHPPQPYHHHHQPLLFLGSTPPAPSTCTPPTCPTEGEATAKAHEILLVAAGPSPRGAIDDEVKMLLWPVFLAACEMSAAEDRQTVLALLDAITAQRRTVTAQRTKRFVLHRVWPARDAGRAWDWMVLAKAYPGECLPI